jgi:uncharacterized hydrophobic protein (TIGR00271 family)
MAEHVTECLDDAVPSRLIDAMTDKPFLVLLPLHENVELEENYVRFAAMLARGHDGQLLALQVGSPYDHTTPLKLPPEWIEGVPTEIRVESSENVPQTILDTAKQAHATVIVLRWQGAVQDLRHRLGRVLDPVVDNASCDVILYKESPSFAYTQALRLLVASAGGPHAVAALQFAYRLTEAQGGTVTVLRVISDESSEGEALNDLHQLIKKAIGVDSNVPAETLPDTLIPKVVVGKNIEDAILAIGSDHDMMLLGVSTESVMRQIFVGSRAERLTDRASIPVVIVRHHQGTVRRLLRQGWRLIDRLLPSATVQERLDTYKQLRRGARASTDFYLLILLSVIIAAMGLLLNSAAVIIGAMLVAPLMSPILGLGIGIVMGDGRTLRMATQSVLQGVLLAIGTSLLIGWLSPLVLFTDEIAGRTQPNLFDLSVAVAAGAAGGYSVARRSLTVTLPGVAIAAALVPPLSVIGLCLATARWDAALGALLLFATNLIAIAFASAVIFLLMGFVPQDEDRKGQLRLRWGLLVGLLLLFIVSLPLANSLQSQVEEILLSQTVESRISELLTRENLALFNSSSERGTDGTITVRLVLYGSDRITPMIQTELQETLAEATNTEVRLRLFILPVSEITN